MGIKESGLSELVAGFVRYNAILPIEQKRTMTAIANETRDVARLMAEAQGLTGAGKYTPSRDPHPGALISKIRATSSVNRATITEFSTSSSARYPHYSYPKRYEYHGRAFMHPAAEAERSVLGSHFTLMLLRTREAAGL
jgi:hypothetical protein